MKTRILKYLYPAFLLVAASCHKNTVEKIEISIFPGECLRSENLSQFVSDAGERCWITAGRDLHEGVAMSCTVDLDVVYDRYSASFARYCPSTTIYEMFGEDAEKVQKSYNDLFDTYKGYPEEIQGLGVTSTIYYCGGMVLTADKSFAGIPAGENLAPLVKVFADNHWRPADIPLISVPEDWFPVVRTFELKFWTEGFEVVPETVSFHLEIPVKVGMLLTLLHERLTNPEAKMQFRDEVLKCTFTIPRGLH